MDVAWAISSQGFGKTNEFVAAGSFANEAPIVYSLRKLEADLEKGGVGSFLEPENQRVDLSSLVRAADIAAMAETSTRAAPMINARAWAMIWFVGRLVARPIRKYPMP